jgi:hypothetical protein
MSRSTTRISPMGEVPKQKFGFKGRSQRNQK